MHGKKRKHPDQSDKEGQINKRAKLAVEELHSISCDVTPSDSSDELPDPNKELKKLGKLSKFRISKSTRKKLKERGVKFLFPIQYQTFDHVYDGKDVIGQARTGTGKTLSFVLPLLERMSAEDLVKPDWGRPPMVLVMAPTRELANQVHVEVKALSAVGVASHCVYGGTAYAPQELAIRNGLDVLVGTPGRILDHMRRGLLNLEDLRHIVLDEADQMLEIGFADSVEEILAASFQNASKETKPQVLLFSATVPSWVQETADKYMSCDRILVDLIGQQRLRTAVTVDHKAISCPYSERPSTIADVIQVYSGAHGRTMIFCKTKSEANELALSSCLKQDCQVLHGDIPQKQRELTLKGFREGKYQVLVATDVAARGLDIPEVDLVVQCEPPKDVDSYIHRSGRTGRAGRTGVSLLFYKPQQEHLVKLVERKAGITFQRVGAPQPVDIIKAGAKDSIRSLDSIPEGVLVLFREAAEELIAERGATDVVAAALAHMSGAKEITSRSLLSSHQGYITYFMYCDQEVRSVSYFWKIIEQNFPTHLKEAVKGMRMCRDSKGVVFDLPSDLQRVIKENWKDNYVKLTTPTILPELKERQQDFYDRLKSNETSRRFGGGSRGRGGHWRTNGAPAGRGFNGERRGFRNSFKQST